VAPMFGFADSSEPLPGQSDRVKAFVTEEGSFVPLPDAFLQPLRSAEP